MREKPVPGPELLLFLPPEWAGDNQPDAIRHNGDDDKLANNPTDLLLLVWPEMLSTKIEATDDRARKDDGNSPRPPQEIPESHSQVGKNGSEARTSSSQEKRIFGQKPKGVNEDAGGSDDACRKKQPSPPPIMSQSDSQTTSNSGYNQYFHQ